MKREPKCAKIAFVKKRKEEVQSSKDFDQNDAI